MLIGADAGRELKGAPGLISSCRGDAMRFGNAAAVLTTSAPPMPCGRTDMKCSLHLYCAWRHSTA